MKNAKQLRDSSESKNRDTSTSILTALPPVLGLAAIGSSAIVLWCVQSQLQGEHFSRISSIDSIEGAIRVGYTLLSCLALACMFSSFKIVISAAKQKTVRGSVRVREDHNKPEAYESTELLRKSLATMLTAGSSNANTFIDSMPVGLLSTNAAGEITTANLTALRLMKTRLDLVVGMPLTDLISIRNAKEATDLEHLKQACMGTLAEGSVRSVDPDRPSIPIDISINEIDGPSGPGLIVNFSDLSDRYELETMREEFVSIVSHDLRTPLSTISMFLSSLVEADPPLLADHNLRAASVTREQTSRLLRLVNSLLDLSVLRAGRLVLEKTEIDPAIELESLEENLRPQFQKKRLTVKVDVIPASLMADKDRFYQVAENMLTNAVKFSGTEGKIWLRGFETDNGMYRVEVRDEGPGVSKRDEDRIFRRFERAQISDARHGGAGLGLTICKLIVDEHNGKIGVESNGASGSCFWFALPLANPLENDQGS